MPFVTRGAGNAVTGLFSVQQSPGQEFLAPDHADVVAFLNVAPSREQLEAEAVKGDTAIRTLLNASPQQVEDYIESNVTNLAQAKAVLKILAKVMVIVWRRL